MSGGIDEIEFILVSVKSIVEHPHGREFDGDAAFALDIHGVEKLFLHVALAHLPRKFHDTISNGALAVIDVSDDTEIA